MASQHFNLFGHKAGLENVIEAPRQIKGVGRDGEVADRVVFMHDGVIVEQGRPAQLLTSPTHECTQRFLARLL